MTETLYLDLFFLENLCADLYLLLLTGLLLREPVKKRKRNLFLGALVGAVSGCVWVLAELYIRNAPGMPPLVPMFWNVCGKLLELTLSAALMTRIAFGSCSRSELLRRVLVMWMLAVLMGGLLTMLESVNRFLLLSFSGFQRMKSWSAGALFLAFVFGGIGLYGGIRMLRQEYVFRGNLYDVILHYRGKQQRIRALWDSGNQLYEPYGHQPVHILEKSICLAFGEGVSGVIYVPYCCVGSEHGLLPAVRMDRMEIWQNEKPVRIMEQPWIAISETPLSPRHQYEMLLHGEL